MDLTFRSIDSGRNRARYYRMSVERDLFGASYMRVAWGRIGHKIRVREERFNDALELDAVRWTRGRVSGDRGFLPCAA